ncbi:IS21 family transposase [Proteinivorax hydrogeniformans]|uniref:IS21 family transposase n=1 Tax=Proteinivorax hydrogeniformans TaxID=1826727 RepID=A0AAU8HUV4_9FIRM
MLTITQLNYIRKMYFEKGLSYSEIERRTGHNYRTIKKYLEKEDFNVKPKKKSGPTKSDLIRPYVREILEEDKDKKKKYRHTAKKIHERLKVERPDKYLISERTMRTLVKEEKQKVYNTDDCHLGLDHPGGEAQVDFGEIYIVENGTKKKAHELVLSFPKSNAGFCQVTRSETMEALCEALINIFKYISFTPNKIWFDQMAAACIRKKDSKGQPVMTERFARLALHYGFEPVFCNPDSGNEKGNVEKKVGYFRKNLFVPEPEISDLEKYNFDLLNRCSEDNQRSHYKEPGTINEIFIKETELMKTTTKIDFDYGKFEKRRVNKLGYIINDHCSYSVSPKYVGSYVWVKILANELVIYDKDYREITRHNRLFEKGRKSTHWMDFIDVIAARPRALKYSGFYSLLPDNWKSYTNEMDNEDLKQSLKFLKMCLLEKGMAFAEKVLAENIRKSVKETAALWTTYYRLTEDVSVYHQIQSPPALPRLPDYDISAESYNSLMGGMRDDR